MAPLPLTTDRLEIRSLTAEDADGLQRVFGDPEAMRYIGRSGSARTPAQTAESVAGYMAFEREHGYGLWAATRRDDGRMIGLCGLTLVEGTGPDVEVVYALEQPAWGLGYATEMAAACLAAGFGPFGLERIIALSYPMNAASIRVMHKCGMRPAGTLEAHGHELVCYEAVPADLA
ncbi:MAG TPA: GNAT family N-acetyltransferase [Gaiellales bacterium]|jgi:RimJ/RimL family protein N-acetyltransferase